MVASGEKWKPLNKTVNMCKSEEAKLKSQHQKYAWEIPNGWVMPGLEISVKFSVEQDSLFLVEQHLFIQMGNILLDSHKNNNKAVCGATGENWANLEVGCEIYTGLCIFASVCTAWKPI